ncbi:LOW QUALITY PROTEIN: hypothetical protein OSB04_028148 [Centaurea solstitialis]|uniref:Uncharacterized protein n=1 Tax=Centaurea solstitialis TaxID=347529 RepID=A0AA38VXE2_9ASTR|nr:LOW QUALITY PROTEIN: hypothetical protein OSB04_028148 [Centaurea solstitialis]
MKKVRPSTLVERILSSGRGDDEFKVNFMVLFINLMPKCSPIGCCLLQFLHKFNNVDMISKVNWSSIHSETYVLTCHYIQQLAYVDSTVPLGIGVDQHDLPLHTNSLLTERHNASFTVEGLALDDLRVYSQVQQGYEHLVQTSTQVNETISDASVIRTSTPEVVQNDCVVVKLQQKESVIDIPVNNECETILDTNERMGQNYENSENHTSSDESREFDFDTYSFDELKKPLFPDEMVFSNYSETHQSLFKDYGPDTDVDMEDDKEDGDVEQMDTGYNQYLIHQQIGTATPMKLDFDNVHSLDKLSSSHHVVQVMYKSNIGQYIVRTTMKTLAAEEHYFTNIFYGWVDLLNYEESYRSLESPSRYFFKTSVLSGGVLMHNKYPFEKRSKEQIANLCIRYTAKILLSDHNSYKKDIKKELHQLYSLGDEAMNDLISEATKTRDLRLKNTRHSGSGLGIRIFALIAKLLKRYPRPHWAQTNPRQFWAEARLLKHAARGQLCFKVFQKELTRLHSKTYGLGINIHGTWITLVNTKMKEGMSMTDHVNEFNSILSRVVVGGGGGGGRWWLPVAWWMEVVVVAGGSGG